MGDGIDDGLAVGATNRALALPHGWSRIVIVFGSLLTRELDRRAPLVFGSRK